MNSMSALCEVAVTIDEVAVTIDLLKLLLASPRPLSFPPSPSQCVAYTFRCVLSLKCFDFGASVHWGRRAVAVFEPMTNLTLMLLCALSSLHQVCGAVCVFPRSPALGLLPIWPSHYVTLVFLHLGRYVKVPCMFSCDLGPHKFIWDLAFD